MEKRFLTEEVIKDLRESFKLLAEDVTVAVFTREGANQKYNEVATQLVTEIAEVEPRIKAEIHNIGDETSSRYGVQRSPTILVAPEKYNIRFTGAPLGEEGRSFVTALIMASTGKSTMRPESSAKINNLNDKRDVRVYVSPT